MEEKIERLLKWSKNKTSGPYLLEVWPTNRCNLRCLMCGTWASRRRLEEEGIPYNPKEEMKQEVTDIRFLELVDEANELGVKRCLLTGGGEPFIRKELTLDLMEKIKEYGMFGNINTNATLISDDDVKRIIDMEWDMVMVSIDAPDPETNDFIRGLNGAFHRIKRTLLNFKREKKRVGSEKPRIVFNTVLTNRIHDKIGKMIRFAHQTGCEDITFIPLIVYDEKVRILEMNSEEREEFKKNIKKNIMLSEKLGINTNLESVIFTTVERMNERIMEEMYNSPKDLAHSPCFEPFLHFLVKANGEATACCMLENSPENIKRKSMRDIWFGRYFTSLRRDFINKNIRMECKNCVFSQYVRNGEIRRMLSTKK